MGIQRKLPIHHYQQTLRNLKPNMKRKQDLSKREENTPKRERKRELPQAVAQPNPLGFLPSVITEEEKGEHHKILPKINNQN
jgi:hypothetical protein